LRRCWPIRSSSTAGSAPIPTSPNLLDLRGLAVPAALHADGTPFGVTLLAPCGHDAMLASIGRVFHAATGLPLRALGCAQPALAAWPVAPTV
jgi:allophanate hydrolase